MDFFAETFLAADEAVFWPVPDDWFSREAISISHDAVEEVGVVGEKEDDQGETSGPLVGGVAPEVRGGRLDSRTSRTR